MTRPALRIEPQPRQERPDPVTRLVRALRDECDRDGERWIGRKTGEDHTYLLVLSTLAAKAYRERGEAGR